MTDLVLVPLGDRFLGLTCEEFRVALERGRVLDGSTATPVANGDAPERLCTAEEMEERTKVGKLVSRTGAARGAAASQARKVCPFQVR